MTISAGVPHWHEDNDEFQFSIKDHEKNTDLSLLPSFQKRPTCSKLGTVFNLPSQQRLGHLAPFSESANLLKLKEVSPATKKPRSWFRQGRCCKRATRPLSSRLYGLQRQTTCRYAIGSGLLKLF